MRPRLQCQPTPAVADVHTDDADFAQPPQQLHRDVADAAGSDDHDGLAGRQQRRPVLDRVVRRERGIRKRGGGDGVEIADRHQIPGQRHDHVSGEAAVVADASAVAAGLERRGLAQVFHPPQAVPAGAAAPAGVHENPIALGYPSRARPESRDSARGFVSQRERQRVRNRSGPPFHEMQVAVAEPGCLHLQQHLARTGYGHRYRDKLRFGLPPHQPYRWHHPFHRHLNSAVPSVDLPDSSTSACRVPEVKSSVDHLG
jgi:hypothetical protein